MPFSSKANASVSPIRAGSARSRPWRAEKFRAPRVTRVEEPSGAMSQSRAITCPVGAAARRDRVTDGRPRISTGPPSSGTGKSKQAEWASSSRWSGGRSASLPKGKKRPASIPVCWGESTTTGEPWKPYVTGVTYGEGQAGSVTQRPGSSS